jgi:hypothetical protein
MRIMKSEKFKSSKNPDKKKLRLFRLVLFLFTTICILIVYSGFVIFRSVGLYRYVKSGGPGWRGSVHQADEELGLRPVQNAEGAQIIPLGSDLEVRFNEDGFRIPVNEEDLLTGDGPRLMALGCSFTFGAGVKATDTFIYLLAKRLNGTAINAGVCSYGLVQMMLLSERLADEFKPDYLIVQFSPWLIERAMTPFAPSYAGKLPVPYFYDSDSGLKIHSPVFTSRSIALDMNRYRDTSSSLGDFISFLWNAGFPMYVHDDVNTLIYETGKILGCVVEPTENAVLVIKTVYDEIAQVCEENDIKLVILVLGRSNEDFDPPIDLFPDGVLVVNAHRAMLDSLEEVSLDTYRSAYAIWRGEPPQLVDLHPNERAHRIIAEALYQTLISEEQ